MSEKNKIIREHLKKTCTQRVSKNCFQYGTIQVKIDHDSPQNGVQFTEIIKVSIYDPETDTDIIITAPCPDVLILNNALTDEK